MASIGATARPSGSVEEILGWEAEHRPRAGIAAIAAGLLILAGAVLQGLATRDLPNAPLIGALEGALQGDPGRQSQRVALFEFLDDRVLTLALAALLPALGFFALIPALGYLYRAAAARTPKIPRAALILGLIGPGLVGVGAIALEVGRSPFEVNDFLASSNRSIDAANDVGNLTLIVAGQLMDQVGRLMTAFALILISLHAMRAGLLTRFMGILGMIAGATIVLLPRNPVLNFWLVALGLLILSRWPGGVPPAWGSGRAVPWPSQQEVRDQRAQARDQDAAIATGATATGDDEDDPGPDRAPLRKRKRKRR